MLQQCGSLALVVLVCLFLGSGGEHRLGQDTTDAAAAVQRESVYLVECFKTLKREFILVGTQSNTNPYTNLIC